MPEVLAVFKIPHTPLGGVHAKLPLEELGEVGNVFEATQSGDLFDSVDENFPCARKPSALY